MELKYKQFVIVPKHPRMSAGKIASQVAHATFMALEKQRKINNIYESTTPKSENVSVTCEPVGFDLINSWKENGMCVIVLECENQEDLYGIAKYCEQWNIPYHLYIDEGLTECKPLSPTAFSTGVLTEDQWWPFGQFKLYKEHKWWQNE